MSIVKDLKKQHKKLEVEIIKLTKRNYLHYRNTHKLLIYMNLYNIISQII